MSTPASAMIQPTIVRSIVADHVRHRERKDQPQRDEENTESVTHVDFPSIRRPAGGAISADLKIDTRFRGREGQVRRDGRHGGRGEEARRLQPVRGDLRSRADGRRTARVTGIRGNPDDPLSRGTSARRAPRSPTSTRTPTGCAGRYAGGHGPTGGRSGGTRRSTGSPTAWPEPSTSTAATRSASTSATRTCTASARSPTAAMVKSFRTRNKFSATSVDQLPHQLVACTCTATSCSCRSRTSTGRRTSWCSAPTRWRRTGR